MWVVMLRDSFDGSLRMCAVVTSKRCRDAVAKSLLKWYAKSQFDPDWSEMKREQSRV